MCIYIDSQTQKNLKKKNNNTVELGYNENEKPIAFPLYNRVLEITWFDISSDDP